MKNLNARAAGQIALFVILLTGGNLRAEIWVKIRGEVVKQLDDGTLILDECHGPGFRAHEWGALINYSGNDATAGRVIHFTGRKIDNITWNGNPLKCYDCLPAAAPKLAPELQAISDQMRPVYLALVKLQQQRARLATTLATKEKAKQDTAPEQADLAKLDAQIKPLAENLEALKQQYQEAKAKLESKKP